MLQTFFLCYSTSTFSLEIITAMGIIYLLSPILKLIKRFGFIYRGLGLIIFVVMFISDIQDLIFLSSSHKIEAISIDSLRTIPKDEIPRFLKIENMIMYNDVYVVSQNEKNGKVYSASYPMYSLQQIAERDTLNPQSLMSYVIVKDNDFNEDSLSIIMSIDGKYDNDSFKKEKEILTNNGVNVSEDAILIVKSKPPVLSSVLVGSLIKGLLAIFIALSFLPTNLLEKPKKIENSGFITRY